MSINIDLLKLFLYFFFQKLGKPIVFSNFLSPVKNSLPAWLSLPSGGTGSKSANKALLLKWVVNSRDLVSRNLFGSNTSPNEQK